MFWTSYSVVKQYCSNSMIIFGGVQIFWIFTVPAGCLLEAENKFILRAMKSSKGSFPTVGRITGALATETVSHEYISCS